MVKRLDKRRYLNDNNKDKEERRGWEGEERKDNYFQ